jgi:hypothetical protein
LLCLHTHPILTFITHHVITSSLPSHLPVLAHGWMTHKEEAL